MNHGSAILHARCDSRGILNGCRGSTRWAGAPIPGAGAADARADPPPPALAARAVRRAQQPAAVPEARLEDEPGLTAGRPRVPPGPGVPARGHPLRRQADHRRGRAARRARATRQDSLREWLASGLVDHLLVLLGIELALAVLSDVLGRVVSLLDALLSERFSNTTSIRLMEHAATLDLEDFEDSELQDRLDRARRQTMGRTALMSQIFGQAQDVVTIASFAAGLAGVRALADRAAGAGARARVPRRGALQRAELLAQLRVDAGAAGARLRPPDRGQRRDREGSEDLRPERVPHRALPRAVRGLLRRQPPPGRPPRGLGRPAHRHRHRRLLRGLRVHRLAHPARRLHDRRPHVPVRRRSAGCGTCSRGCSSASRRWRARPSTSTTSSRSSRSSPRSSRRRIRGRCPCPSARGSRSRTWASATRARSAGRCAT